VAVDPADGAVFMVVSDQGLWRSADGGGSFERVADGKTVGGRCETGFALNVDPAGKRMVCFMIYGGSARSDDLGKTWTPLKASHLDYGAVDWEAGGRTLLALRHEKAGLLTLSTDGGATWKDLDKGFHAVGVFGPDALIAARGGEIVRSVDGGATWTKAADAKPTGAVMRVHKGVGYFATDKGLLASRDKGATWEPFGSPVEAVFGPWFGKTDDHLVVVGKKGFLESRDGGKTWAVAAPLPPGFPVGRVGPNYAWDPVGDVFYASTMGKHTYRYKR
jgi:photosystem II stability/assembly factor-like uncharacterized protein